MDNKTGAFGYIVQSHMYWLGGNKYNKLIIHVNNIEHFNNTIFECCLGPFR